jgi:polysaccharide export outer membrane protein
MMKCRFYLIVFLFSCLFVSFAGSGYAQGSSQENMVVLQTVEEELGEFGNTLREAQEKLVLLMDRLAEKEEVISQLKQKLVDYSREMDSLEDNLRLKAKLLEEKDLIILKLKESQKQLSQSESQLSSSLTVARKESEKLNQHISFLFEKANQEINLLKQNVASLSADLEAKDKELTQKSMLLEEKKRLISEFENKLSSSSRREKDLSYQVEKANKEIIDLLVKLKTDSLIIDNAPDKTKETASGAKKASEDKGKKKTEPDKVTSEKIDKKSIKKVASLKDANVSYFIASGDVLEVFVWQNADLSKDVVVGPDGNISYPLTGRVKAAGLSLNELEGVMKEKLSRYVKYPQVSITVKKFSGNKIVVLGEIESPGIYTYTGSLNLIEAVAMAGDFSSDARSDSVMVVHGNLTENPQVRRVNMLKALKKGTSQPEIILKPNDVVYVPRSFIGNFNKFLDNLQPTIDLITQAIGLRKDVRIWSDNPSSASISVD